MVGRGISCAIGRVAGIVGGCNPHRSKGTTYFSTRGRLGGRLSRFSSRARFRRCGVTPGTFLRFAGVISSIVVTTIMVYLTLIFAGIVSFVVTRYVINTLITVNLFVAIVRFLVCGRFVSNVCGGMANRGLITAEGPANRIGGEVIVDNRVSTTCR